MQTETDTMPDVLAIVQRHHGDAWRRQVVAQWQDQNGRPTKAKRHAREIAEAEARVLASLIADLRLAGHTIADS